MSSFLSAILFGVFLGVNPGLAAVTSPVFKNASTSCYSGGLNVLYQGYSTNPALQCECITQFENWFHTPNPPTRTLYRTIGVGAVTTTITTKGSTITTVIASLTTETATVTGNFGGADGFDWYGSAKSPCCSSCTIAAATVDLFYFPTPAVKSAATSFVSNNYTFISPSVYIGFSSLYAYDFCGNVGNSYVSTTLAFDPTEISTAGSPTISIWTLTQTYLDFSSNTITETDTETESVGGPATQINFRDLGQNCSTLSGYYYLAGNPSLLGEVTYDPCHPTIILPDRVKSLDPAWSTCLNNGIGGFYDPPYPLTSVAATPPPPSAQPAPAPTLPPPVAPVTTTSPTQGTTPVALSQIFPIGTESSAPTSVVPPSPVADPQSSSTPSNTDSSTSSQATTIDPGTSKSSPPQSPDTTSSSVDPARPLPNNNFTPQTTPTQTEFLIGTQTVKPGSAAIESGTTYSLASSGGSIFVNGVLTTPSVGSFVIPPSTEDEFVIGSQTIQPGSAVTQSGTTYSLAPTGGSVFVDGVATTPHIGSLIMSIISPGTTVQEGGGSGGRPTSTAVGGHGTGNGSAVNTGLGYIQVNVGARSRYDVGFEWVVILLVGLVGGVIVVL